MSFYNDDSSNFISDIYTKNNISFSKEINDKEENSISNSDEILSIKNNYDNKVKELENKISILERTLLWEKKNFDLSKNEFLNTIENDRYKIFSLNNELITIREKLKSYLNIIESFSLEKQHYEYLLKEKENYKLELESQIKQNEILCARIEELDKLLNVSKDLTNEITFIQTNYKEQKSQNDDIFSEKELLEKELVENKYNIKQMQVQLDTYEINNKAYNFELNSLKEHYNKLSFSLKNTIETLTNQLKDSYNIKFKVESENSQLINKITKLNIDLEHSNNKIEELEQLIKKQKDQNPLFKLCDKKFLILQNSKNKIDKINKKSNKDKLKTSCLSSTNKKTLNLLDFSVSLASINNKFHKLSRDKSTILNNNIKLKKNSSCINFGNNNKTYNCYKEKSIIQSHSESKFSKIFNTNDIKINNIYSITNMNNNSLKGILQKTLNASKSTSKALISSNDFDINKSIYNSKISSPNKSESINATVKPNQNLKNIHNTTKNLNNKLNSNFQFTFFPINRNLLLSQKHWSIIKNWFDILNIENSKNMNLNLIMKASCDGFSSNVFKKKCHKKASTLVIVLTSYDKLIGGYTPLRWNSGDFDYIPDPTRRTFLFSLTKQKIYKLINPNYAICNGKDIGPIFGGGSDLEIVSNCNKRYNTFSSIGHSFENDESEEAFYGGKKYLVKDYEVYEVIY